MENLIGGSNCKYIVKMEVSDDPVSKTCPQCTNTWVSLKDMSLMFDDKRILERGGKLIDKHINYAQRLLKSMFSAINGLHLILLQDKPCRQSTSNSIQILHINGDHGCVLQQLVQRSRCCCMILGTPSVISHHYPYFKSNFTVAPAMFIYLKRCRNNKVQRNVGCMLLQML